MSELRRYAPSFVLMAWALAWQAGAQGHAVIAVGLTLTALAVVVHVHASFGRRR